MLQEALDGDPYLASHVQRIDVEQQHKALYSIWRLVRPVRVQPLLRHNAECGNFSQAFGAKLSACR